MNRTLPPGFSFLYPMANKNVQRSGQIKKSDASALSASKKIARLVFCIVAIYFLTLTVLIFAIQREDLRSLQSPVEAHYPGSLLSLLYFAYYGMPAVIAALFGFIFKPFWKNFRLVLVIIFLVHWAYSTVVYTLRYALLVKWHDELQETQEGKLQVFSMRHKFYDDDKNSVMDRVELIGEFDLSLLANGEYLLEAFLSQDGQRLPNARAGAYRFILEDESKPTPIKREEKQDPRENQKPALHKYDKKTLEAGAKKQRIFQHSFQANLNRYQVYFVNGPLDVDFELRKILRSNEAIEKVLCLSRWAAFLRTTSWEGYDPDLKPMILEVQTINSVYSFNLLPLHLNQ